MKKIITTFLILGIFCNHSFSQPVEGKNYRRPQLNKFTGTWKYVSGDTEVVVMLKKVNIFFEDYAEDLLLGIYSYKVHGSIVEDYLEDFPYLGQTERGQIFVYTKFDASEPDIVRGSLRDNKKKNFRVGVYFQYSADNPLSLHWQSYFEEGGVLVTSPQEDFKLTLPTTMILTKQP